MLGTKGRAAAWAPVTRAARQGVDGARERSVDRLVGKAYRRRAAIGERVPEEVGVSALAINGVVAHLDSVTKLDHNSAIFSCTLRTAYYVGTSSCTQEQPHKGNFGEALPSRCGIRGNIGPTAHDVDALHAGTWLSGTILALHTPLLVGWCRRQARASDKMHGM